MSNNSDVLINIMVSDRGVEKVQLFGGGKKHKKALQLYEAMSDKIKALDRSVKAGVIKNASSR